MKLIENLKIKIPQAEITIESIDGFRYPVLSIERKLENKKTSFSSWFLINDKEVSQLSGGLCGAHVDGSEFPSKEIDLQSEIDKNLINSCL